MPKVTRREMMGVAAATGVAAFGGAAVRAAEEADKAKKSSLLDLFTVKIDKGVTCTFCKKGCPTKYEPGKEYKKAELPPDLDPTWSEDQAHVRFNCPFKDHVHVKAPAANAGGDKLTAVTITQQADGKIKIDLSYTKAAGGGACGNAALANCEIECDGVIVSGPPILCLECHGWEHCCFG